MVKELKKVFVLRKFLHAFFKVFGAQACATSIIRIRSNWSSSLSSADNASNSRPSWVLVVHNSQIKGREVAQGGYWRPLVPLPK